MGNGPAIHRCAPQFPGRHRRQPSHLAGWRVRSGDAHEFDGNLCVPTRDADGHTNTNRDVPHLGKLDSTFPQR